MAYRGGMSKAQVGVAVSVLFNVAVWTAPGIPDKYRPPLFAVTLILLAAACVWWWLSPKESSVSEATSQKIRRSKISDSNVAAAGRDIHQTIYYESHEREESEVRAVVGLEIEALEPIPDLLNMTQLSWYEGAKVIFTGDAAVSIKNLLPAQGINLVNLRLLQISPSMKSVKAYKPSTLDAVLKRIDFSDDVPEPLLGGKAADVRLFKVTRPLAANNLKDITIEFYGKWPEGYYSVFTPQERHQMIVEVTGSGVRREEATFELHFSCKKNESVLSIKTIRSAVGKA